MIADRGSKLLLSLPSGTPDSPLWPLHVMLLQVLVVRTWGKMTETEGEKKERQVKLGSSETQKPHKKPTLAGMEDIGRPKESRSYPVH